jgi:hypothetical protein
MNNQTKWMIAGAGAVGTAAAIGLLSTRSSYSFRDKAVFITVTKISHHDSSEPRGHGAGNRSKFSRENVAVGHPFLAVPSPKVEEGRAA